MSDKNYQPQNDLEMALELLKEAQELIFKAKIGSESLNENYKQSLETIIMAIDISSENSMCLSVNHKPLKVILENYGNNWGPVVDKFLNE
jgi:hypothetical protein